MEGVNLADPSKGPIASVTTAPTPENPKPTMTILEAMLQTADRSTWQSYFDLYASQTLKEDVQEIIQRAQTGGGGNPVTTGSISTEKEVRAAGGLHQRHAERERRQRHLLLLPGHRPERPWAAPTPSRRWRTSTSRTLSRPI